MENLEQGDTSPLKISPPESVVNKKIMVRRWPWILLGLFFLLVGAGAGTWMGYQAGLQLRLARHQADVMITATTQFQLGIQDQAAGRLDMARRRFEYVIQLDPSFPGAAKKLTEVMLAQAVTEVPTAAPTPTLVPTPDMRGVEDLIKQAQFDMRKQDWDATINVLDTLRKADINYRSIDADGMYYLALRYRGINKVLKEGNLEGGLYDLSLAERFGPLDRDADSYRTWARIYLAGASFWGVDWPKVIDYFGQIVTSLPGLRDNTNFTVQERYRIALLRYGDQLAQKEDWCGAQKQYQLSLEIVADQTAEATLKHLKDQCSPPVTKTPKPTKVKEILPTDNIAPTSQPPIDTIEPTIMPSDTPLP
jgi:tetratricopeptide (TPR) repeat protein